MLTRRQGLWLLAVMFTPLTIVGAVLAVEAGDAFMWPLLLGSALITVVVDTWLVVDLRRARHR
ncbi:hypothetical protein [Cellulomonas sp. URHE0023]|uniref:hypothetical protein n=1 Tax=Cellulomonas sp. URHE0023 TaxID=1380354 RepID=UPI000489EDA9|nr:hypothetical protein [Cellulomonas sp. URHE0023]